MSLTGFLRFLRYSLQQLESRLIQTAGLDRNLGKLSA